MIEINGDRCYGICNDCGLSVFIDHFFEWSERCLLSLHFYSFKNFLFHNPLKQTG